MDIQLISINRLQAHPGNCNVMPERLLKKLVGHLDQTDRYPPVVVRPISGEGGVEGYQIIDGHHRIEALKRLERLEARCVVWEVSDDEALLLLATLNRLEGKDDPMKRAQLVAQLNEKTGLDELAKRLPENLDGLEGLLTMRLAPPTPRAPASLEKLPVAVYFFLQIEHKQRLEKRLKAIGGSREEALMRLVEGC